VLSETAGFLVALSMIWGWGVKPFVLLFYEQFPCLSSICAPSLLMISGGDRFWWGGWRGTVAPPRPHFLYANLSFPLPVSCL
jgi:hypothetical protein